MRLKRKHKIHLQILVFLLMIGLMVVLNHRQESSKEAKQNKTETIASVNTDHSAITPLFSQVPDKTEGALPIKLISNPFSNFLVFVNHSHEFKINFQYNQQRKLFLGYCTNITSNFLIEYISTARNKGHL